MYEVYTFSWDEISFSNDFISDNKFQSEKVFIWILFEPLILWCAFKYDFYNKWQSSQRVISNWYHSIYFTSFRSLLALSRKITSIEYLHIKNTTLHYFRTSILLCSTIHLTSSTCIKIAKIIIWAIQWLS